MFASKSIPEHLARGAIAVALVFLRGCPTCWTVGLVQTVIARLRGKATTAFCVDGRCSLAASPESRHVAHRPHG